VNTSVAGSFAEIVLFFPQNDDDFWRTLTRWYRSPAMNYP
jgi:hypothetical protein